jgi:H+/Cl- antiporter ClcA
LPFVARVAFTAAAIIALAPIAQWWFGAPLHRGPGYRAIEWAADPNRTVKALVRLLTLRAVATWLGVARRAMGGLFIPPVTQGAIVGSVFQHFVHAPNAHLFPTIGIAEFLGAGFRPSLAGVAFVAEATGQPRFLVPALLAAAVAQTHNGPVLLQSVPARRAPPGRRTTHTYGRF